MNPEYVILNIAFFYQIGFGVLGNLFLISLYLFMFLRGNRVRPIDSILTQIAWANCLVLLPSGIPWTMKSLGLKNILGDIDCKIIFYIFRMARGLTITMTCLLSGFQALTISPRNSKWAKLKVRAPQYITTSIIFCWVIHLLLNIFIPLGIRGPRPTSNITEMLHYGYCSYGIPSGLRVFLFATILSFPDVVCVVFMVSASGYMVSVLYRHHKQVRFVSLTYLSPRASPETRATKMILLLVTTFVSSYSLNCILTTYISLVQSPVWLIYMTAFLALCFPAISPYVLISSDSRYLYALWGGRKIHILSLIIN